MKHVPRRIALKAAGVSVSLPLLECMAPAEESHLKSPRRMVTICTTLGLHGPSLWPKTAGTEYESTDYLDLLKEHRSDFTLYSGLCHERQSGRRPHDSEATWLTAATNPGFAGFRNSISMDQVAAQHVGRLTRFPSMTLGSGSSASQSFSRNGVMIPSRTRPSRLFRDLFLDGTETQKKQQLQRLENGRSVLDHLGSQLKRVQKQSGASDSRLLDEYFESIRAAEKNIQRAGEWQQIPKPIVDVEAPRDIRSKSDIIGRLTLLLDLIPLVLQTDSTRVVSVMIQDHNAVPQINGITGNHHNLSHHGQDQTKIDQLRIVESKLVSCFSKLLTQLKTTPDGSSNLLAQTSVLFGSNLGNANMHSTRQLPIILAGGGFKHGRFEKLPDGTPLSNLFVTLLQRSGIPVESFGQSTGPFNVV